MKEEEKFLITGLLITIMGYVLYKVWKPEQQKSNPLAGITLPKIHTPTPAPKVEIDLDDLTRMRQSVTSSLRE